MIERSYCLIRCGLVFVCAYYDLEQDRFIDLPPWNQLERQGKPIHLALAEQIGPDKWTVTRDIMCTPVYPRQNLLTGDEVTHEHLHALAGDMGCAGTFSREAWLFMGGRNPWQAALQASPVENAIWHAAMSPDYSVGLIEKAGGEIAGVLNNEIMFWREEKT
jgi:hypothetical protein